MFEQMGPFIPTTATLAKMVRTVVTNLPKKAGFGVGKAGCAFMNCPLKKAKGPPPDRDYAKLRVRSPSKEIRALINRPKKKKDAAYGTPVDKLEADHIIPLKTICALPGFSTLSYRAKLQVANLIDNFIGLSKSSNASKGSKSFTEWMGHSKRGPLPAYNRKKLLALEQVAMPAVRNAIRNREGT